MMMCAWILAAALSLNEQGVSLTVDTQTETIDPGRSVLVTVTATAPAGVKVTLPELGSRLRGFASSESFGEEPVTAKDGSLTQTVNWRLVPEPCAPVYKIAPFCVKVSRYGEDVSFVAGPVLFKPPAPREAVEGAEIEIAPENLKPDPPPWTWKKVGRIALWVLAGLAVAVVLFFLLRLCVRRVKEIRLSPVERALVELDRLLAKSWPQHGRYKDFYVELTLVVRRYLQRAYGIRAPHLTTEEFLAEVTSGLAGSRVARCVSLKDFLESSDRIKFAGLESTPELASEAAGRARTFLKEDARP